VLRPGPAAAPVVGAQTSVPSVRDEGSEVVCQLASPATSYFSEPDRPDVTHVGIYLVRNYNLRWASCVRDLTSSLRNTLAKWYSTVAGLMKS
jgi:hypothetical protein